MNAYEKLYSWQEKAEARELAGMACGLANLMGGRSDAERFEKALVEAWEYFGRATSFLERKATERREVQEAYMKTPEGQAAIAEARARMEKYVNRLP